MHNKCLSPLFLTMMCQIAVAIPASSSATQVFSPNNLALHGMQTQTCSSPTWMVVADEKPRPKGLNTLWKHRPGRIEIPAGQMSSFCDDGHGDVEMQKVEELSVEGCEFSVFCKKGKKRGVLEDRYSSVLELHGDTKQALFGVFDGHGGVKAAEFAAKNLDKNIMAEISGRSNEEIEDGIRDGYRKTDAEFLKQNVNGGTCCVTALIRQGDLIISNAGDCRAVLSHGGVAEAISSDHRPSREDERNRIESRGGYVDHCRGAWRIHGTLAVSRAIGDGHLKEWVTAEPDTQKRRLDAECEFLVLASDGLWDQVGNQEAVDIVRPFCLDVDKPELFFACKKLVDLSIRRGSMDDICVLIVQLGCFIR